MASTKVIEVGPAATAAGLAALVAAEPLAGGLVRVRWTGATATARAVTLVVADSAGRVLAAQTDSAPPFAAVFDTADGGGQVALVGATVAHPDGARTTALVPLAAARPR